MEPGRKDEDGERLFDRLTAPGRELVPVAYRFLHLLPPDSAAPVRLAESRFHRATGYVCWRFHRPISKCRSDVP
ncbi:MAG TPA: hypothetical protein VHQ90_24900 [Thermoanaerobaculia bacterium]|nr:hypothetical protein [Thermoanaerobaculia bacterium]